MKKILLILAFVSVVNAQGIRSLNGSQMPTQKLRVAYDDTATYFRWSVSDGIHTLWIPFELIPNDTTGILSLNGLTASVQTFAVDTTINTSPVFSSSGSVHTLRFPMSRINNKANTADSTKVSAGYGISVAQSGHTATVSADSSVLMTKGTTQIVTAPKYWTARQYMTSLAVDTLVDRTNNGGIKLEDSLTISGTLTVIDMFNAGVSQFNDAVTFSDVVLGGTYSGGIWQGTAIDTPYSTSIAHISGGYGITATRYNTKDFQITADSATLRSKFVPYSGANASVNLGAQTLTTTGAGSFGALSGTVGTFTTNMLIGTLANANTTIFQGASPYIVQKNNSETDGGIVLYDAQDTTQRGFMTYGSGSNNLTIGNSTANSIILDGSGNVILGSTSGTIYGTGANDLGRYDNYFDSTFVTNLTVSGTLDGGGYIADTSAFSGSNTRAAVYIQGATQSDKYSVDIRLVNSDDATTPTETLFYYAKADSLIVRRSAGTTSGLKFSYIRIK